MSETREVMQWIVKGHTGLSSETIWSHFVLDTEPDRPNAPRDPADFLRCYWLLKLAPHWTPRLAELGVRYPKSAWASLAAHWDELTAMLEEVWPRCCASGDYVNSEPPAEAMYARMKELGA